MKKQRGFSLIELMIVLGMISILTAIPVIVMPRMQYNARVVRGQRIMQALVREARDLALANRSFVRIRIATVGTFPTVMLSEGRCPIGQSTSPCASCPVGNNCTTMLRTPIVGMKRGDFFRVDITPVPTTITFNPWGTYVEAAPLGITFGTVGPGNAPRSVVVNSQGVAKAL